MKKTILFLLSAVVSAAALLPALAQTASAEEAVGLALRGFPSAAVTGTVFGLSSIPDQKPEAQTEESGADKTWTVTVLDPAGNGISGCVVAFCDESACLPVLTDENGVYTFRGETRPAHVRILKAPSGYICDPSLEYALDGAGDNLDVTLAEEQET